jgi:hypothetical protein
MEGIMKFLRRSLLGRSFALFLFILSGWFLFVNPVYALSVNSLGDYDNITVMEVAGDYSAIDGIGDFNLTPRQEVSRAFYNDHGDEYDFLVIFTDFDYLMPAPGATAFFHGTKNAVEGIGLDLFDASHLYSADGAYLDRLQGVIDMADLDSHVLEPNDPAFEKTLQTLTHEMMHRWGAYLSFLDDGEESDALLGLGNAHWSFLLDAQGSTLYGNHWQDNGDGTYTSVAPEQSATGSFLGRILSPLDLYLMGINARDQVPPITLIDSPGIDPNRLPELGVTIPGSAWSVSIDQIIAAMGDRFPSADPEKTFRMAFLLLVRPDTWSEEEPFSQNKLRKINNLRVAWEKRFSVLTGGSALVQTSLVAKDASEVNPGVSSHPLDPHLDPHVNEGVNWLLSQQLPDGHWQDQVASAQRDTAAVVAALKRFAAGGVSAAEGQLWLRNTTAENNDFLARKLLELNSFNPGEIEQTQNIDGGWGSAPGYQSNPVDSALVLRAMTASDSGNSAVIDAAIAYLQSTQAADGGWSNGNGPSMVQATASVLLALDSYRNNSNSSLQSTLDAGLFWLTGKQNLDGGFGNSLSTVYDSAMALMALKAAGATQLINDNVVNYLLSHQGSTGSWDNSPFLTSLAVQALYTGSIQTDLQIEEVDLAIVPFPVVSIPSETTLSAQVWNHGEATAENVRVSLYEGSPGAGSIAGDTEISIPGHSFINVDFPLSVVASGDVEYYVVVDQDDLIEEASNNNNLALIAFHAGEEPKVGFAVSESSAPESVSATVDVILSHQWDRVVTVDFAIHPESTAVAGSDYNLTSASVTFNPGELVKSIDLGIVKDTLTEADEVLILTLSNPVNSSLELSQTNHVILNDDVPPEVGFSTTHNSAAEDVGTVSIVVELSTVSSQDVSVDYLIDAATSSASLGEDALLQAGSLLILAGETTATIPLVIIDDTAEEPDETLTLKLTNPSQALLGIGELTYTIHDNDAAPQLVIMAPVNNEVYTSGPVVLQYQTNMPEEQVEVYLNDRAVETRSGGTFEIYANDNYLLRLVATNINGVAVEEIVTFEVDDSGQPPELVWQDLLQGGLAGGKYYTCLQYGDDGSVYAVKDVEYEPLTVHKFDLNNYVHWAEPVPDGSSAYNSCKDAVKTEDAYVILDSTSLRWFSDVTDASGLLSHNLELPIYEDSSPWSRFTMDQAGHYFLAGATQEGISSRDLTDGGHIQLAKMDVAGTILWRHVIATDLTDSVTDVATDSAGDVYLYGSTGGYLGEAGGGNYGETDVFLIKLSTDGQELWRRQWGTFLAETSSQMVIDSQGNVVLSGSTFGSFDGTGPSFAQDAFVIKVAADGTDLWLVQDHGISAGEALTLTGEDDIVVAGWYGQDRSNYHDNLNLKWSRYSAEGLQLWNGSVSTGYLSYNDSVLGLAGDPYGNLFISTSYLYENYTTYQWESRGVLNRYKTGMDYSPPLLAVEPYSYDPVTRSLNLSGHHEYLSNLTVEVDSAATVTTSSSPSSVAWSSVITDLFPGKHNITIKAIDDEGVTSEKVIAQEVVPATPFSPDTIMQYGTANLEMPVASTLTGQDQLYLFGYEDDLASGRDVVLWKVAADGSLTSLVKVDLGTEEQGQNLTSDEMGHLYMAWNSGGNAYVSKYEASGDELWRSDYAARKGTQEVYDVAVDSVGNVYISGATTVSPDRNVDHGGGQDYFLVKYDSNGSYLWSRLTGPGHPGDQTAYTLALDSQGNVYLAGSSQGQLHGVNSANSGFVVKYNGSGDLLWVDVIESDRPGKIKSLVVDQNDNLYLLGEVNQLTGQDLDIFLTKYNASGEREWSESFGGDYADTAKDLSLDQQGNLLFTGLVKRTPQYNDILWAKYDVDGRILWQNRFDASLTDSVTGIHTTSAGSIQVTGSTKRTLGDTNYGSYDLFVHEFTATPGPELIVDLVTTPRSSQSVVLTGRVSPGAEIRVFAESPNPSTIITGPVNMDPISGTWSCQLTGLVANVDNLIAILASDRYGSTQEKVSIHVDLLPPEFSLDDVPLETALPTIIISGTLESGALLSAGVNQVPAAVVNDISDGFWNYLVSLDEGDNIITFTATDDAGNINIKSLTITRIPPPPPSLHVSPDSIQEGTPSEVTLNISNPDGIGAPVYITLLYDVTGDGVSSDDVSVRKFYLYDGLSSDDPNVPGDEDGVVNGHLTTTLNYHYSYDVQAAPGHYILRANMGGLIEEALLEISTRSQPQTIQGYVLDQLNRPVAGGRIQLLDKWQNSFGYVYADDFGHYLFNVAHPGSYSLVPTARGFAYKKSEIGLHYLAAGQNLDVDLTMIPGDSAVVSGLLRDAYTGEILTGGNYVRAENDRYIAEAYDFSHIITTTDDVFKYTLSLPEGDYEFFADSYNSRGSFTQGYLGLEGAAQISALSPDLFLDKATGQACGTVHDSSMLGVPGILLWAGPENRVGPFSTAITDANGDYCIGLADGESWRISLNDKANQATGYVGGVIISGGVSSRHDLSVAMIDSWLEGVVIEEGLLSVAGVPIKLFNELTGHSVMGETTNDGSYRLGLPAGDWIVTISPESLGYSSVDPLNVTLLTGQTVIQDVDIFRQQETLFVDVTVQTPTDQSSQTIHGNCSENAEITVVVNGEATIRPVVSLSPTSWECEIVGLLPGENLISVSASNGVDTYHAPAVYVAYQTTQPTNTIAVSSATYVSRKSTLSVDASSAYSDADLVVEYSGIVAPMIFEKLFKGEYRWSYTDTNVSASPGRVVVSGSEGRVESPVVVK